MDAREAARLQEHYRRWLRPDWRRWLRADWEQFVHPAHRAAMREDFALRDRAFETPHARAVRLRHEQAALQQRREEKAALEREQAWEAECAERKRRSDLAWARVKAAVVRDLEQRRLARKYSPDQPRDELGRWTDAGGNDIGPSENQLEQSLTTAREQSARSDLSELQEIANDSLIRSRINEAWSASNPLGTSRQEQGFWISRNEAAGELFTRPFENPGSAARIAPGPTPSDAIAFFHTHPNPSALGYLPGPSRGDEAFAASVGLPGLLQSHGGMYYFGPQLRASRTR